MRVKKIENHNPISNSSSAGELSDAEAELNRLVKTPGFNMKINELRLVQKYEKRDQNIKVSIIMPTWNRGFIIERAIDSILRQSYRNFELIISDDGSSDDTEKIIRSNYKKDERIRYIKSNHSGVSQARNIGLDVSTGDLIAYLDSDNMWFDNYLLLMVNSFVDRPNMNTMYCAMRVINNVGGEYYKRFRDYNRKSLLVRNFIDISVFMHKRFLFELLGGFNKEMPPLEDWELIIRYTKDNPPFVLNCCLANYYLEKEIEHLTSTKWSDETYKRIRRLYNDE